MTFQRKAVKIAERFRNYREEFNSRVPADELLQYGSTELTRNNPFKLRPT
jgi:hypothetical protein